jgi:hypothetical protein
VCGSTRRLSIPLLFTTPKSFKNLQLTMAHNGGFNVDILHRRDK